MVMPKAESLENHYNTPFENAIYNKQETTYYACTSRIDVEQ